jgi:hypothetical protein
VKRKPWVRVPLAAFIVFVSFLLGTVACRCGCGEVLWRFGAGGVGGDGFVVYPIFWDMAEFR